MGYAHARLGNRTQAFGVLERLQDLSARRHICAYDIGLIHMALEEKGACLRVVRESIPGAGSQVM